MGDSHLAWLVARISPQAPKSVYTQLVEGGHGAYVPTHKVEIFFRFGKKLAERPLLPGYVFIRYTHRWPNANGVDGVEVLTFTDDAGVQEPHVLPDDFVETLSVIEAGGGEEIRFRYGDWVRITVGAATGCFGRVKETQKGKVTVTVDFMGGERVFYIPQHALDLARPSNATDHNRTRGPSTDRDSGTASVGQSVKSA